MSGQKRLNEFCLQHVSHGAAENARMEDDGPEGAVLAGQWDAAVDGVRWDQHDLPCLQDFPMTVNLELPFSFKHPENFKLFVPVIVHNHDFWRLMLLIYGHGEELCPVVALLL